MCYLCGQDNHDDFENKYGNIPPAPTPPVLAEERKKQGKCPDCGELGVFSHFNLLCLKCNKLLYD